MGKQQVKDSNWKTIFGTIITIWIVASIIASSVSELKQAVSEKIVIIPIVGPLTISENNAGILEPSTASTEDILENIKKAKDDSSVKAVIFEINSPGGTVVASEEIANAVKNLDKPNIALIREVGASGAYWVASASDKIVASPMSITGSIGVISSYLEFSKLFDKYGITYQQLTSGEYKDVGTPYKELSVKEKDYLQKKLDIIYDYFISEVSKNRNMDREKVKEMADGKFYLGTEAKDLGLIDYLGDREFAVNLTKQMINKTDIEVITYKQKLTFLEQLTRMSSYYAGKGIGETLLNFNINKEIKINA